MSHLNRKSSAAPGTNQQQNRGQSRPQADNTPLPINNFQQWTQGQALPQTPNNAYQGNHIQHFNQGQARPQKDYTTYPGNNNPPWTQDQARSQADNSAYPGNYNQQLAPVQARPQTDTTVYPRNYNQQPPNLQSSNTAQGQGRVTFASNTTTQTSNQRTEKIVWPKQHDDDVKPKVYCYIPDHLLDQTIREVAALAKRERYTEGVIRATIHNTTGGTRYGNRGTTRPVVRADRTSLGHLSTQEEHGTPSTFGLPSQRVRPMRLIPYAGQTRPFTTIRRKVVLAGIPKAHTMLEKGWTVMLCRSTA